MSNSDYKILISPFSRKLRNNQNNPKNYPHWRKVVEILRSSGIKIIQVGEAGEELIGANDVAHNLPLEKLKELVLACDTWASVDNFFHHFCALNKKPGVVLFGKSDPIIYGHSCNVNLLKDRKYLRKYQYDIWEAESYAPEVFVDANDVCKSIVQILLRRKP